MVTKKNSRSPWAWIPTLYFAEGLPQRHRNRPLCGDVHAVGADRC